MWCLGEKIKGGTVATQEVCSEAKNGKRREIVKDSAKKNKKKKPFEGVHRK